MIGCKEDIRETVMKKTHTELIKGWQLFTKECQRYSAKGFGTIDKYNRANEDVKAGRLRHG